MKVLLLALVLAPWWVLAQGTVNVNNRGLNPPQLVLDGSSGEALLGTQYVAQIIYGGNAQSLTHELGPLMPFRASTTSSPGTWNPGANPIRTLEGFTTGQTVWMQVRVWDSSMAATWEASEGTSPRGESQPYAYIVGANDRPAELLMVNFTGFRLTPRPPVLQLAPRLISVAENGPAVFIAIDTRYGSEQAPVTGLPGSNPSVSGHAHEHLLFSVLRDSAAVTQTNGGMWLTPRPGVIGQIGDFRYTGIATTSQGTYEYDVGTLVMITPSPRRPFLDISGTNATPSITLRGLPPARYRLEGSTDLAAWNPLGELEPGGDGNAPVPPGWLSTDAMHFIRFTPSP